MNAGAMCSRNYPIECHLTNTSLSSTCSDNWWREYPCEELCNGCRGVIEENEVDGKKKKKNADRTWERKFAEKLQEGPYSTFKEVKSCEITMHLVENKPDNKPDDKPDDAEVTKVARVGVECKKGNLEQSTPEERDYTAQALMKSYNKLHASGEHGIAEMHNLHYVANDSLESGAGSALGYDYVSYYYGDWGCTFCYDDPCVEYVCSFVHWVRS